jgi:SAM-dependent methyltransferase
MVVGSMGDVRNRTFAMLYDRAFAMSERSGLRANRKSLLARAEGRVLELGAGTGLNVDHYPAELSQLILTEPEPHMMEKLALRVASHALPVRLVRSEASWLAIKDASIETVVGTLVLCTVPDPEAALREVARVLVPGGRFLFIEHVASESTVLRTFQDLLHGPWSWLACGCQCNRSTLKALRASPLTLQWSDAGRLKWLTPLLSPLVTGCAVKPIDGLTTGSAETKAPIAMDLL